MSRLAALLKHVAEDRGTLTQQQGSLALREMLEGDANDVEIASLLTALAARGAKLRMLANAIAATSCMRMWLRSVHFTTRVLSRGSVGLLASSARSWRR